MKQALYAQFGLLGFFEKLTMLAINQNFTIFGQCPATALWLVPVIRELAPQIPA